MKLDTTNRQILNLLQDRLPLDVCPFVSLAKISGLSLDELLERIRKLKESGIIRQISAIFDSQRLGYQSTLAAARVAPERLAEAAAVINRHPGVSHNYARNHAYNLWFTVAVSPESRLGLRKTVELLANLARADSILVVPTLKRFKIGVYFDMAEDDANDVNLEGSNRAMHPGPMKSPQPLSEEDKEIVRILQQDLPLVERPFQILCENSAFTEQALVEQGCAMLQQGVMRRFSAVLRHRKAGFHANGMGVWPIPEEQIDVIGSRMAQHPGVSHCYHRPTFPDWPYTLFTMVHGRSPEQCNEVFRQLSEESGIRDYRVLFSTEEFKRARVRYFTPEEARWEKEVLQGSPAGASRAAERASS